MTARQGWGGNEIDIALYADVLRRHRVVVLVGVGLTVALAVLSYVRVSPSGISYRSSEIWSNQATLVLTQEGAPELRSVLPVGAGGSSSALADTGRFASLIDVYTTLATGDAVVAELRHRGFLKAKDLKDGALPIVAAAVPSTVNVATPMMTITATALTGPKATKLTEGAMRAFLAVVDRGQRAAKIPVKERIQVRVVKSSEAPKLINPRSKALPILVLLAGLIATVAVAFIRDNTTRGRARPPVELTELPPAELTELRSATAIEHETTHQSGAGRASSSRGTLGTTAGQEASAASEKDVPYDVPRQAQALRAANETLAVARPGRTLGRPKR